jgi:hypothetical protein
MLIAVILNLYYAELYRNFAQSKPDSSLLNGARCHLAGLILQLMVQVRTCLYISYL